MRVHIVSDSRSFIDAVGELSLAHGIDYSTYAHLTPLYSQAHVYAEDAVVVDLPCNIKELHAYFDAMETYLPRSLIIWFVSTLSFELPTDAPASWHVLEKPFGITVLEDVLNLKQRRLRITTVS